MKYFTYEEFDSPDLPGSGHEMQPIFLEKLDLARGLQRGTLCYQLGLSDA